MVFKQGHVILHLNLRSLKRRGYEKSDMMTFTLHKRRDGSVITWTNNKTQT